MLTDDNLLLRRRKMKAFDLQRMAFDKAPPEFLGEVALRCLFTFVLVFLFLKITGRRGVRQMSLFEVLIILTLGSAAGLRSAVPAQTLIVEELFVQAVEIQDSASRQAMA